MLKKLLAGLAALIVAVTGGVVYNNTKTPKCDIKMTKFVINNDSVYAEISLAFDGKTYKVGQDYQTCYDTVAYARITDSLSKLQDIHSR